MDSENPLGRFLRARRALVRPEDLGLPAGDRRRVAGLRREEVAVLAGVSTDYYVRLEQGRERSPSAQVVDALARVLCLEEEATAHLHRLARPVPAARRRTGARREERVGPHLLRMVESWHRTPAAVLGPRLNVLAQNTLCRALYDGRTHADDPARMVFLDPDAREFYPDWEKVALDTVAGLRAAAGAHADDPELVELVGELSLRSETFRSLWARHDVRSKTHGTKRFRHPLVGELTLEYESLTVNSAPGRQLLVYHAEPGSPSEQALDLLGSLAATGDAGAPRPAGDAARAHGDPAGDRPA
ncbi:helix-turn-helix transcriptional regulator [Streptomyces glaucosporus]